MQKPTDAKTFRILKKDRMPQARVSRKGIAPLPKGSFDPPHRNVWTALRATRTQFVGTWQEAKWRHPHEDRARKTQKRTPKDWDRALERKRTHYPTLFATRHWLRKVTQRIARSSKNCLGTVQGLNFSSTGRSPGVKFWSDQSQL